ncbi:hypothetical protein [Hymenobacter wooponensis]|uniref:Macroglobulin domain-containing protein n=1 Tax=Hymenobacter wooponensis TaxID=1525360 RepID=A0A4Z0MJ96_9BACT|nr:hypothetical protein [Hymenobacter wooponensis]TGD79407.1 hypothetical protein EU557_14335 [Hymenobacter wooponensis]
MSSSLTKQFTEYSQQALQEKLYLHLDRPLYLSGELLWFKINAVDGIQHRPLDLSKVAYVEVLDKDQRPVLQTKVELQQAKGQGSLALPASLASGNYTIRAYTSWMKNFPADYFFHSTITIVNTRTSLGLKSAKDTASYAAQFFPEGGTMLKDVPSKVAFKIVDKTGKGIAATGTLLDERGAAVASFSTLKYGLGSFVFTPKEAGAVYTAVLTLPSKQAFSRKLPSVAAQGVVLRVEDSGSDQLRVNIISTVVGRTSEELLLLGHSRQQVSVSAIARLQDGKATVLVNKKELAEGITHFTVFNQEKKPLCERLYFTRPAAHQLTIAAATSQKTYGTREKVSLQVATSSLQAQPIPANASLAVFRLDSLPAAALPNINSYLWLTSDLKGTVENPDYYVNATGPEAAQASDNLMLTHGWSRFRWTEVLTAPTKHFTYSPELNGLAILGRITQIGTGNPVPGIMAYLASPSRKIDLYNSVSNADGMVQFEPSGLYSTNDLIVQTNTEKDSIYQIELLNPFSLQYPKAPLVPFTFSERNQQDILNRSLEMQTQNAYFGKQQSLYRRPPLTDSIAFYGKPDEKYMLDDYTRFKVLEEVMREYVPGVQVRIRKDGFHFMVMDHINKSIFQENPLVLLDGVPVFNINKIMAMDPLKIQKLEVMTSNYFQGAARYNGIVSYSTYKGDLAGFELNPRALIQEYEGLQYQREFYSPSYASAEEKQRRLPDMRNLLYWNPEVNTTSAGPTTLEFYTSDQPGTYVVVVQGLSADGLSGSTRFQFEVKPAI